jgi:hypothetical protein
VEIHSNWLHWTWSLGDLLKNPKDETTTAAIKDLCTKISGEFNTHELFKQIATLKDLLDSGHWLFTSPGTIIVITILVVVVTLFTWKTFCGSQTQALSKVVSSTANQTLSVPPPLMVFNRTMAAVTVTLNYEGLPLILSFNYKLMFISL